MNIEIQSCCCVRLCDFFFRSLMVFVTLHNSLYHMLVHHTESLICTHTRLSNESLHLAAIDLSVFVCWRSIFFNICCCYCTIGTSATVNVLLLYCDGIDWWWWWEYGCVYFVWVNKAVCFDVVSKHKYSLFFLSNFYVYELQTCWEYNHNM